MFKSWTAKLTFLWGKKHTARDMTLVRGQSPQMYVHHPFHLVDIRPWPLTGSMGSLCLVGGLASWMHKYDADLMRLGLVLILITIYL